MRRLRKQAMADVVKDMMGIGPHCPRGDALSGYSLAGAKLDNKIKRKIWNLDYVELATLLPRTEAEPRVSMFMDKVDPSAVGFTSTKTKKTATVAEWNYLFSINTSVYLTKYPEEGSQMVTYMNKIHDMYLADPHTYFWRTFDEEFRRFKKLCKEMPWHVFPPNNKCTLKSRGHLLLYVHPPLSAASSQAASMLSPPLLCLRFKWLIFDCLTVMGASIQAAL